MIKMKRDSRRDFLRGLTVIVTTTVIPLSTSNTVNNFPKIDLNKEGQTLIQEVYDSKKPRLAYLSVFNGKIYEVAADEAGAIGIGFEFNPKYLEPQV